MDAHLFADAVEAWDAGGEHGVPLRELEGRAIRVDYAGQKPKKEGAWGGGGGW